jgi:hypothetical protein
VSCDGDVGLSAALAARTEHGSSALVGTPDTVESVVAITIRTPRDPFTGWPVTATRTRADRGAGGRPDLLGVPVVGNLDCVTEHVKNNRCRVTVSVTSKSGWSGHRRHQPAWNLDGAGVELVVDSLNSTGSGGG